MRCGTLLSIVAAGLIWGAGCASTNVIINSSAVTPITHQPESGSVRRTIGLLRRLVVLPARLEFSPSASKQCLDLCNWEQLSLEVAQKAPSYLAEWRGYEVVRLDPLLPDHASVELPIGSLDGFVDELLALAEQRSSEPPGEQLASSVRSVGKQLWVDGLVVIRGSVTVPSRIDLGLAFPLAASGYGLLAALPLQMVRIGSKFEVYIFETETARLVWAAVYSSGGNPVAKSPSGNDVIMELLDPIEPALPAVMTRTINPPEE
jgi:hypothetical protein